MWALNTAIPRLRESWRNWLPGASIVIAIVVFVTLVAFRAAQGSTLGGAATSGQSLTAPVLASDVFGRAITDGWGDAEVGGTYDFVGSPADFMVGNGVATMVMPTAGATRAAILTQSVQQDIDVQLSVAADKVVNDGSIFVYVVARHTSSGEYRPRLIVGPDGGVSVHASVVVDGTESPLGSAFSVRDIFPLAGTVVMLRTAVTGLNPTIIKVKAWTAGQPEPADWLFSVSDSTPSLQVPGAIGLGAYLGAKVTNAPVSLSFDNLRVIQGE